MIDKKLGFEQKIGKASLASRMNILKSFLKVLKVCLKYNDYLKLSAIKSWDDQILHDILINLRIKDRDRFSLIYDLMQKNICLDFFCSSNNLAMIAANFLDIKKDEMMVTSQFRMDTPTDKRNIYDWHQDSAYDKLNKIPTNGAVLWIPMIDTNQKNGTIIVKPKSQIEKNVYELKQKWKKYVSPQLTVPNSYLEKYKSTNISVKKGNILAMYPNLFHKSGNNTSKKIRITIIARFNKILTSDFTLFNKRLKP